MLTACSFKLVTVNWCDMLFQSPPHLVNSDATLLQYPWERNADSDHSTSVICNSDNSSHWGTSSPDTSSICQHDVNAESYTMYNGRLLETAANAHQMALRPPSDLQPTLDRDLFHYNPELDATENREYFHINSLLFAAHQLRSQRCGGHSFFDVWSSEQFLHSSASCDIFITGSHKIMLHCFCFCSIISTLHQGLFRRTLGNAISIVKNQMERIRTACVPIVKRNIWITYYGKAEFSSQTHLLHSVDWNSVIVDLISWAAKWQTGSI